MELGLRLPSTQLAFAVVALVLVADLMLPRITGVAVQSESIAGWGMAALVTLLVPLICAGAIYRLRNDMARGARLTSAYAERVALAVLAGIFIGLYTTAGAVLTYHAASFRLPFQDATLVAIDRSLGIEWLKIAGAVCGTSWLEPVLAFAYRSSMTQVLVLVPLLSLLGRRQRLSEFLGLFVVTGTIVCVLSALVPAEAAFFHFSPSVVCEQARIDGTLRYHPDLLAIRGGGLPPLDFKNLTGIVTFPSFHTILAILVIYATWTVPFVRWPALILNLLVIAATLPLGGHYFIDVVAGAAIAVASILAIRRLNRVPDALSWPLRPAVGAAPLPHAA